MTNTINKTYAVIGSALLGLVLSFAMAAFPAQANANGYTASGRYSYTGAYACPNPYMYPNGYYYCATQTTVPVYPVPQQPTYQPPVYQYPSLTATCYAANSNASVAPGTSVQWTAYASGGAGNYTYSWSGTDGLYGSGPTAYMTYYNPGYKTANLTVYSGGQTISVTCSGSVNVYDSYQYQQYPVYQQPIIQQPQYVSSNASGLQVGCYTEPTTASINQPVTWNVEVTGGAAPYTYSWTGSDGLTGSGPTAIKYYQSAGSKNAIVSVTSADGRSTTWACSNTVTVKSAYVAPKTPSKPVITPATPTNDLGAAAFFSLSNVPWGWVAVLVILVLFATVMYLVFNKTKI